MQIADHFAILRQTRAHSPAISFDGATHCFGELVRHGWQVGNGLLGIGIPRRHRIAILARNRPEFFELLIGAGASGRALAVLDWRKTAEQLAAQLEEAGNQVLFVAREFHEVIEHIAPGLAQLRHIIALDGEHRRWPDYERWRNAQLTTRPKVRAQDDDELLHLYAPDAIDQPRGIKLTNRAYERLLQTLLSHHAFGHRTVAAVRNRMPLFHLGGVNRSVVPLLCGAHLHLLDGASAVN